MDKNIRFMRKHQNFYIFFTQTGAPFKIFTDNGHEFAIHSLELFFKVTYTA